MNNIAGSVNLHIRNVSIKMIDVRAQYEENKEMRCISIGIDSDDIDATIFFKNKEEAHLFLKESLRQLNKIK